MALSKLAVRRLTKLADYMAKLPASANKHFNMGSYFDHNGDHQLVADNGLTKKHLMDCGTTACAFGWAATVPAFRKAGLSMDAEGEFSLRGCASIYCDEIAKTFFDIDSVQQAHLFGSRTFIKTPKQWAKYCREFIKENA
jgi:hypothetical protein